MLLGLNTWNGCGVSPFNAQLSAISCNGVRLAYQAFPGKNLLFTEGCIEHYDINKLNDWAMGERYGQAMINDFNAGTAG